MLCDRNIICGQILGQNASEELAILAGASQRQHIPATAEEPLHPGRQVVAEGGPVVAGSPPQQFKLA